MSKYKVTLHYQATADKYSYSVWAYVYKIVTLPFAPYNDMTLIVDGHLEIPRVQYDIDKEEFTISLGSLHIPELENSGNKKAEIKHLDKHLKKYVDKGWAVEYKDVAR